MEHPALSGLYEHYNNLTPIPQDQWESFLKVSKIKKVKKKETLLQVGDHPDKYYIVLTGLLRMFYTDPDGNEFIKAFRDQYDLASPYGELIQNIPSRISIDAIEDSEILEVNYKDIKNLSTQHECWKNMQVELLRIHFLFKEQREYDLLILDAKQRYQSFVEDFPSFIDRVPKFQIASYLGITPVSLSRLLSTMDK